MLRSTASAISPVEVAGSTLSLGRAEAPREGGQADRFRPGTNLPRTWRVGDAPLPGFTLKKPFVNWTNCANISALPTSPGRSLAW